MNERIEKAMKEYGRECAVAGEMVGYKKRYDSSYVRALEAELIEAVEEYADREYDAGCTWGMREVDHD